MVDTRIFIRWWTGLKIWGGEIRDGILIGTPCNYTFSCFRVIRNSLTDWDGKKFEIGDKTCKVS